MKHKLLNYFCLFFILAFVAGCEDKEDIFTPKTYNVSGKVEKGPFINGSKITAQALDKNYNLTGEVYQGVITDNDGSFDFGEINLNSPYVLLTADGYYFNEVYGELSDGQISMQSIVNLTDNKQANVNILTHLKTQRMMQLIRNNIMDFDEADAKVQKEVLRNFGLERYADQDVCNFSIASGTEEAGALIVVSSALLKDRSDAELTEYLAMLSSEFKAEGRFMDDTKEKIRESSMLLKVNEISDNIIRRYKDLGVDVTVPNLNYFIDWDGDGIAGNEPDAGGDVTLTLDKEELEIPAEGGTFRVKIDCKVPVTLEKPAGIPGESISVETLKIFKFSDIDYTGTIQENELEIVVQPAAGALVRDKTITVYTTSGRLSVDLRLTQKGDPSKPVEFGEDGQKVITGIALMMATSMQDFSNLDGYYTQSFDGRSTAYRFIYEHTLTPSDSKLYSVWGNVYSTISRIKIFDSLLERSGVTEIPPFMAYIHQLAAVQYFQLASWWENVPYVISYDNSFAVTKQLVSRDLFANLVEDLNYCVEHSKLEPGKFDSSESFLYPSQGASLALLAKMYLHQKSYDQAYAHLKRIIDSGVYALELSSSASLTRNSRELIWGLLTSAQPESYENVLKENDYVPFVTYTEVLLSASECAYRLGNQGEAMDYLNRVRQARNLPPVSGADFIESLRSTWQSELKGFGSYFAFLRRNDLATGQLKIESYQQLLPIPQQEIDYPDSKLIQNPGWGKKQEETATF